MPQSNRMCALSISHAPLDPVYIEPILAFPSDPDPYNIEPDTHRTKMKESGSGLYQRHSRLPRILIDTDGLFSSTSLDPVYIEAILVFHPDPYLYCRIIFRH